MGLTMVQRKAVTKANATRYKRASKANKGKILDELCHTTGWHRNHPWWPRCDPRWCQRRGALGRRSTGWKCW